MQDTTLTVQYSCLSRNVTTCPSETIQIEEFGSKHCVLLTRQKASRNKTMKFCQDHGGQLAAFNDSISFRKISAFVKDLNYITTFWFLDQVPDIRPNTRRPDVCTKAVIDSETDQTNLAVIRECSGNLRGLCAFPPYRYDDLNEYSKWLQPTLNDATEDPTMHTIVDVPIEILLTGKYCPAQSYGGFTWPSTNQGATIVLPCPPGQDGYASWTCEANGEFNPIGPDFSNCVTSVTADIHQLSHKLDEGHHPDVVVTDLAMTIKKAETIASGDIINVVDLLDKALIMQQQIMRNMTNEEKEETMNTFTLGVVNSTGAVLVTDRQTSWFGLNTIDRAETATKLLANVDSTGFLYASLLTSAARTNFEISRTLHLYVASRNITDYSQLELPNIIVPTEAFQDANKPDSRGNLPNVVPIVVATYDTIGHIMPIGDHFQKFTNVTQVIGATLNKVVRLAHDKVSVIIKKPTSVMTLNQHFCVFWNKSQWSTDGCELSDETNDTHFVCKCDHMTSFAVLMSFNPKQVDIMPLNIITIIGCSVSILCLAACIIAFLIVRSLRTIFYKVHMQLCISLMIADTILIVAHFYKAYDVEVDAYCTILAMLLHYFYLATFMWMFLEGVQLYLALVRVFAQERKRGYVYYLIGYGIPGLVVGISAGVNMEGYVSSTDCFLNTESGLIWGFIAFVLIILMFNTGLLFLSLKSASRLKIMCNVKQIASVRQWLWHITILHPLLGLTWIFGLLQFGDQLVFSYVFTILNSLQGMFIFLFHVFRNKDVRHGFARIYIICGGNDSKSSYAVQNQGESSSRRTEESESEYVAFNPIKLLYYRSTVEIAYSDRHVTD